MPSHLRSSAAAIAACLLVSCGSSSVESSSGTKVDACIPLTFPCKGFTPGFWTSPNGCEANPGVLTALNAFLAEHGFVETVDDCDELEAILLTNASDMAPKLLAMWIAFVLNFEGEACDGQPLQFVFDWTQWIPEGGTCGSALEALFASDVVTLDELAPVVKTLLESGTRCEQETLKNFFDAANNDAAVCTCECVTGGNGGFTGGFSQ